MCLYLLLVCPSSSVVRMAGWLPHLVQLGVCRSSLPLGSLLGWQVQSCCHAATASCLCLDPLPSGVALFQRLVGRRNSFNPLCQCTGKRERHFAHRSRRVQAGTPTPHFAHFCPFALLLLAACPRFLVTVTGKWTICTAVYQGPAHR